LIGGEATSHFQELMRSLHEAREAFMPKLGQADQGQRGLRCARRGQKIENFNIHTYIYIIYILYIYYIYIMYYMYIYIHIWDLFNGYRMVMDSYIFR
jgi:hypothetical protein